MLVALALQVLYEDEKKNRLTESVEVFENIVNNKYFKNSTFVLFLNKVCSSTDDSCCAVLIGCGCSTICLKTSSSGCR